jgi:hypothetical protein
MQPSIPLMVWELDGRQKPSPQRRAHLCEHFHETGGNLDSRTPVKNPSFGLPLKAGPLPGHQAVVPLHRCKQSSGWEGGIHSFCCYLVLTWHEAVCLQQFSYKPQAEVVVHTCNPIHLGDWGKRIRSSKPAWASSSPFLLPPPTPNKWTI